jgi:quercetin dioxygenase-like cupin family protein
MSDRFDDERGVIQDLFDNVAVTRITTAAGAVRGNHVHKLTTQWTLVIDGCLIVSDSRGEHKVYAGEMVEHKPGEPHAWKALWATDSLVFTRGPRSGEDYESDTYRLEKPLL